MHDDDVMDQLLREAMRSDAPELSAGFDARLRRRVQPRRLTPMGRAVFVLYVAVAGTTAAWLLRDLSVEQLAVAIAIGVPVAAGLSVYGRRLAVGH